LPIPETKRYDREIHYYLFSPPQLYVNKNTYSEERLLHKFQSHGRYSSPEITLEELLDMRNNLSPLTILKRYTDDLVKDVTSVPERNVIHELQTIVNSVRHENKACLQDCKDMVKLGMVNDLEMTLNAWHANTNQLCVTIRDLVEAIQAKFSPDNRLLLAFLWADEANSLLCEKHAIDLYMACSSLQPQIPKILSELLSFSREEMEYRSEHDYPSGSNNSETVQYRKAILKKWTQSSLYLVPEVSRWPKRVQKS